MPEQSSWAFGLSHLFTVLGMILTTVIATVGLRTFGKWRMEKIEEKRMDIAFEALSIAYESKYIFDQIRCALTFSYEYEGMPRLNGESDAQWRSRGTYWAIRKRVSDNKDFFERVFKLQPRFMALFGRDSESIFMKLHAARRKIEVSSEMLAEDACRGHNDHHEHDVAFIKQCKRDIWDHGGFEPDKDEVGRSLKDFVDEMEALCRPVVNKHGA